MCISILERGRLQRANGFSNALILAAARTECTRVIHCRKKLADRLALVDCFPEGKGCFWAAFCRLSGRVSRVGADKLVAIRLVKEITVTSVASVEQLPVVSSDFRAIIRAFERQD